MRTLGLKDGAGGTKRDSRNVVNLVKPGGFPEGVSAVVTHPGLLDASEGPRERRTGVMTGNLILERIGVDRYRLYTTSLGLLQWVFVRFIKKGSRLGQDRGHVRAESIRRDSTPIIRVFSLLSSSRTRRRASCGRRRCRPSAGPSSRAPRSSRGATSSASSGISAAGASNTSSSWIWRSMRAWKSLIAEILIEQDHGPLDQVGGRALDDGVDRRALGEVAERPVVDLIPLIGRRRPRIVSTRPAAWAASRVLVMNRSTPAYSWK